MATPILLSETMLEGTTGLYSFALVDEEGAGIDSSFLTTLTLTLYDVDSNAIINNRAQQDILNANDGSLETDPGPPLTTTVTLAIQPADTVILNEGRLVEYRVLTFSWTWDSGRRVGRHSVSFGVENLLVDVVTSAPSPLPPASHKYVTTFTATGTPPTVLIAGAVHGLQTADLSVTVYDASTPRQVVHVPYTVDPLTFDIVLTMSQPFAGRIVVLA